MFHKISLFNFEFFYYQEFKYKLKKRYLEYLEYSKNKSKYKRI